LTEAELVPE